MKKKIINGIMMVALVAATSTSFVSCKDTNEDVRVEQAAEIADLQSRLNDLDSKYGGICNELDQKINQVQSNLDAAKTELEGKIQNNADQIAALDTEIGNLEIWLVETFAKLVTSVEISGTYNNMLGSINVPGFEPKMLINNWGIAASNVVFPKYDGYDGLQIIIGEGEEIGTNPDSYGFAGYIYANVNRYLDMPLLTKAQDPDNGIFDFTIANTAGEDVEGLMVGNVDADGQPTTDVLRWGWTRADNNIFKFAVAYGGENAKAFAPAKIDLSKFKADLKQVWADRNRHSGTSKQALGHLVADLYYNLATKDTNMKKYALKVTWKDNTVRAYDKDGEVIVESNEDNGLKHMVTSEAELVFITIKPLSFNSGQALAEAGGQVVGKVNYTVEKLEPYLDKILNKIKKQIKLKNFDESIFYDGTIAISDGTGTVPAGHYILTIPGTSIDAAIAGTGATPGASDLEVDIDEIVNPIKAAYENVNDMMDDIKNLLAKINGTNITNWVEKFTNKAGTLFANNADQMLQPVLLAIDKDGNVNRVSGLKNAPYEADGEITLEPTTYTAELFAPCYAKFLGCKDIEEAGFNEIIYSNEKEIKFTPESGKTYEIVYQALDFFGNVVEHSYYIQGK